VNQIKIGDNVNIGDRATIHITRDGLKQVGYATNIGHNVFVGPLHISPRRFPILMPILSGAGSIIHGATLEDNSFVDAACVILDGAVIGKGSQIAAGSLVLSGTQVPAGQVPFPPLSCCIFEVLDWLLFPIFSASSGELAAVSYSFSDLSCSSGLVLPPNLSKS